MRRIFHKVLYGNAVRQRLVDGVPARIAGGLLIVLTGLFLIRQIDLIITALISQVPVDTEDPTWISDLTVLCPMWLIGGVQLWRRKPLGYIAGAGLFLLGSKLFIGAIIPFVYPALATASPIDVSGIVFLLIMGAICIVPLTFFIRRA